MYLRQFRLLSLLKSIFSDPYRFFVFICCVLAIKIYFDFRSTNTQVAKDEPKDVRKYILKSPACKVPYMDPFDDALLKHINKQGERRILCQGPAAGAFTRAPERGQVWLNTSVVRELKPVVCVAENAVRNGDDALSWIEKRHFLPNQTLDVSSDLTRLRCLDQNDAVIVEDYVSMGYRTEGKTQEKSKLARSHASGSRPRTRPNVLMIGIDSVSHNHFVRSFPKTRKFLAERLKSVEFKGQNVVAYSTFGNVVPALTGESTEYPLGNQTFDHYPFAWKNFSDRGYWTMYGEDNVDLTTFNYKNSGFTEQPTDRYFRPLELALNENKLKDPDCYWGRAKGEWMFEWLLNGLRSRRLEEKYFAFVWSNHWTNEELNDAANADRPALELLQTLHTEGFLTDTVLFFFSDHGFRTGKIIETVYGRYEKRMPFLHVVVPRSWDTRFPDVVANLRSNARSLTTPFDLYETLLDLMDFQAENPPDRSWNSATLPSGLKFRYSLFSEIPWDRDCHYAAIKPHWCICQTQETIHTDKILIVDLARFVVKRINEALEPVKSSCHQLKLTDVERASKTATRKELLIQNDTQNDDVPKNIVPTSPSDIDWRYYVIAFRTTPGNALFEATVRLSEMDGSVKIPIDKFVTRETPYGRTSECVNDFTLRSFCYCRKQPVVDLIEEDVDY